MARKRRRKTTHRPTDLVTMMDVAVYSGYSRGHLYNLRSRGEFVQPHVDLVGIQKYLWRDVVAWLAQRGR